MEYTQDGLFVGALDNATNCTSNFSEQQIFPKLMLMVLFQGAQLFKIDGVFFHLDAGNEETQKPVAFMLNVARASTLCFFNESRVPLRKVMISAPHAWLHRQFDLHDQSDGSALTKFFSKHLAAFSFEPGQHILQLAQTIINPPAVVGEQLQTIYLQAQGLDIMWQSCLNMMAKHEQNPQHLSAAGLRNCERIRNFIMTNLEQDLSIDLIAYHVGSSASTIQRHFKDHYGITIYDFIKRQRLELARCALVENGIPISQAAHLAGYNNTSSFTTAFRKIYGYSPKKVQYIIKTNQK